MSNELQRLTEEFYRITGKITKLRNKQFSFNGTEPLNTAAIHLIDVIGKHPEYNATQIANSLGNTKGAVSQMAAKLEEKGLIIRKKSDESDKEITYILTADGQRVYDGHENLHNELYARLDEILGDMSAEDFDKMQNVLKAIDDCMTEYGHL